MKALALLPLRPPLKLVLASCLLAIPASGCATVARNDAGRAVPGESVVVAAGEKELGFGRTYRLHLPPGADDGRLRPLVVGLHGGVATARIFEQQTGLDRLADEQGFILVLPNGIGVLSALRHWNAGWCCAKAARDGIDDVGFVDRVIDAVARRWPVDRQRVYIIGYSNGGMLAHLYAAQRAEEVAGLAVYAAPVGIEQGGEGTWLPPEPARPVPTLVVHGSDDQRLDVNGEQLSGRRSERGSKTLGAIETARWWARSNGCETARRERDAPTGSRRISLCSDGETPVETLLLEGATHEWPSPPRTLRRPVDDPLRGFDATRAMLEFFGLSQPQDAGESDPR